MGKELIEGLDPKDAQEFTLQRDGNRDLQFRGWILAVAEQETARPYFGFGTERAVIVSIYLSEGGAIITHVHRTTSSSDEVDRYTAGLHDNPTDALEWLTADAAATEGLGRASKAAWIEACETAPALSSETVEQIA